MNRRSRRARRTLKVVRRISQQSPISALELVESLVDGEIVNGDYEPIGMPGRLKPGLQTSGSWKATTVARQSAYRGHDTVAKGAPLPALRCLRCLLFSSEALRGKRRDRIGLCW